MSSSRDGLSNWILDSAKGTLCCYKRHVHDIPSEPRQVHPASAGDVKLMALGIDHRMPMPATEDELNAKFTELVDELGLQGKHRDAMFCLPPEKKWQIYCSKKTEHHHLSNSNLHTPENYIAGVNSSRNAPSFTLEDRIVLMESLKTALRTQPMSFVMKFLELDGLDALLNFLEKMDAMFRNQPIHTSAISCIQNIMNSSEGRTRVLSHPRAVSIVAHSLVTTNARTKIAVLELLGATCLVPGGHIKVLQAMTEFQEYNKERTRFQSLVVDLDVTLDDYRWNVALKIAIMSFINALIKFGPGKTHSEFRLHLRYEFLMLGIQPIIEKLRLIENETLDRHLDFFEMVRTTDEKEFAQRFSEIHVDTKNASSMFDLLRKKLSFGQSYPHFLSIFFHLLQLPMTGTRVVQTWQLVDRIVQQVALQSSNIKDSDSSPLEIDVKKLVSQLTNESAIKETQTKMRETEKINEELTSKLAKKERECESKTQEKDDLMNAFNKTKARLEKEASNYQEQINHLRQKIQELEQHLGLHGSNPGSIFRLDSNNTPEVDLSSPTSPIIDSPPGAPPPLPPPMGGFIPPPPPPPLPGGLTATPARNKNIPQPNQPLKSFNWSKIPENKLQGTIWTEIDDAKVFKVLDLEDFERNFSAYQRQDESDSGVKNQAKARELTVIDGKRAQNCTIMLSKLKMTNQELATAILSVDKHDDIPKDMCEQLLKFVPTSEEIQMLSEHIRELNQMARADLFLFEMSRIDHYEERLKALYFKKSYSERMSTTTPRVKDVLEASREVAKSRCLRGIFELVLAFGNYMNRGQRGNASGFRISSLNKIIDTKSSINKRSTLLHYLAEIINQKYQNLLNLEDELSHVKGASKIKITELDTEIGSLRTGLNDINKELKYQQTKPMTGLTSGSDCFVSAMSEFVEIASCRFSDLEYDFREMKEEFDRCVVLMGEETKKIQPDEFFGIFDQFLVSLSEVRTENSLWQKIKDQEEIKAQKQAEAKAEREKRKIRSESNLYQLDEKGEMEDLIDALRNMEAFGTEPLHMRKKGRARALSQVHTFTVAKDNRRPSLTTNQNRVFMIS